MRKQCKLRPVFHKQINLMWHVFVPATRSNSCLRCLFEPVAASLLPKHAPSKAYEMMMDLPDKEVGSSVDEILGQHGWEDPEVFLGFLDDLCKVERKYWGLPPSGHGSRSSTFHIGGRKAFDALRRLHQAMSDLALRKIESNGGFEEIWPGLRQHKIDKPQRSYIELTQHVPGNARRLNQEGRGNA